MLRFILSVAGVSAVQIKSVPTNNNLAQAEYYTNKCCTPCCEPTCYVPPVNACETDCETETECDKNGLVTDGVACLKAITIDLDCEGHAELLNQGSHTVCWKDTVTNEYIGTESECDNDCSCECESECETECDTDDCEGEGGDDTPDINLA